MEFMDAQRATRNMAYRESFGYENLNRDMAKQLRELDDIVKRKVSNDD